MSGRQPHKYPSGERTPGSVLANSGPPGVPGMPFRVVVACIVMVEDRIDVVESMMPGVSEKAFLDFSVLGPQDAGELPRTFRERVWHGEGRTFRSPIRTLPRVRNQQA